MKRYLIYIFIALSLNACDKTDPEGPTDVRIYNNTTQVFDNVSVKTSDDPALSVTEHNFGTVSSAGYTGYFRFDIAYPEADITLTIGGVTYSTPATDFSYLPFIGQDRITYKITIADAVNHLLDIETIREEPIDDLK